MVDAPAIVVRLPAGPADELLSVATREALRALPTADLEGGENVIVEGGEAAGDRAGGVYVWAPSSEADDQPPGIIRPDDVDPLEAGRWLEIAARGFIDITTIKPNVDPGTTDFVDALEAAIAMVSETIAPFTDPAGGRIFFPPGEYYFSDTIVIDKAVIIEGCATGSTNLSAATVLRFAADKTGFNVRHEAVSGTTTGAGTTFRNLVLVGSGSDTGAHGIEFSARIFAENVGIRDFGGNGYHCEADGGATGEGSLFRIIGGRITDCGGSGVFLDGGDTNAFVIMGLDLVGNGNWGIENKSFLGGTIIQCHASLNGVVGNGGGRTLAAVVTHGGKTWAVHPDHEAAASTQAPGTGTAWVEKTNGEAVTASAWVSGTTYKAGGAYCATSPSGHGNLFVSCYSEGSQPPTILVSPAFAVGGTHGAGISGLLEHADSGRLSSSGGFYTAVGSGSTASWGEAFSNLAQDIVYRFSHATIAPDATGLKFNGTGLVGFYTGNEPVSWQFTTTASPYNFGRSAAQKGVLNPIEIFLGAGNEGRAITVAKAPPTTGYHAKGERVFNNGDVTAFTTAEYWTCDAPGTPGTWTAVPR